ncbi:MAG: hypothetical protein H3C43_04460 [Leptonema sp. (in: Bacteria)]|nr:hypothetical protein [Leptonema sp. (in: bacteria)]
MWNDKGIADAYREYQADHDPILEDYLIHEIYRYIMAWLKNDQPDESFLAEIMELMAQYEEPLVRGGTLLDLCLWELMEVAHAYYGTTKDREQIRHFLTQARLPLLARINEDTYRALSQIEFHEVDFFIHEIIDGNFPHEAAQSFLKTSQNPDIWLTIRYLDELEGDSIIIDIIESMLHNLQIVPEKYMMLAYLIYCFPEKVESWIHDLDQIDLRLSDDTPIELVESIYNVSIEFLQTGELKLDYRTKMKTGYEAETLFALLSLFEISQTELTPAWIQVIEESIANQWTYRLPSLKRVQRHQPLPEFAISIISVLDSEDTKRLFSESRVLALFFENLHRYTRNTFDELVDILSSYNLVFTEELELQLSLQKDLPHLRWRRFQLCAGRIGKQLVEKDGRLFLIEGKNL